MVVLLVVATACTLTVPVECNDEDLEPAALNCETVTAAVRGQLAGTAGIASISVFRVLTVSGA